MDEIIITREEVREIIARADPCDLDFGDDSLSHEQIINAFWTWLEAAINEYLLPDMIHWATGPRGIATDKFNLYPDIDTPCDHFP